MPFDVQKGLEVNGQLKEERRPWEPIWQLVSEYCLSRKVLFTTENTTPADFLNSNIWSATASKALETAASALIGMVWPDSKSFKLEPFGDLADNDAVKKFFVHCTKTLQAAMDDPGAGLSLAFDEFMLDALAFGTPAIHAEEGETTDLKFDAWNVSHFCIDEGDDGYVDTFYMEQTYTVRNAVTKFGLEKLSRQTQEAYKNKRYMEKINILHVIEPRMVTQEGGEGPQNMPWVSAYIEVDAKHLVKESGFRELPTFAFRYSKRIGEKYGRSPAMRGLPDIMELNSVWEIATIGMEKSFDPPLALLDDGSFGNGTIDTSAGAISVINITGKLAKTDPIRQIQTVGNFSDIAVLIERLEETVKDHFMIDRLFDFNNETEMTAREATMRAGIRQQGFRSFTSRFQNEVSNRIIERGFNILLRKGRFGYIPDSPEALAWQAMNPGKEMHVIPPEVVAMQGKQERAYTINYLTPAARAAQMDAAQGILNLYEFVGQAAPLVDPNMKLKLNGEKTVDILAELWAVPAEVLHDDEEYQQLVAAVQQQMMQQQQMMVAQAGAGTVKDLASAGKAMALQ